MVNEPGLGEYALLFVCILVKTQKLPLSIAMAGLKLSSEAEQPLFEDLI